MPKIDKRVDAYIAKAQPFAKPILEHVRDIVHAACPEVEETIKWGFPHFDYKGIMCSMASFKEHAVVGFWKASFMSDKKLVENAKSESSMGHLGQLKTLKDLPSDKVLLSYVQEAMKLNEDGVKSVRKKATPNKPLVVPAYLKSALGKNKDAKRTFEEFSPSNKREYITWLEEAKTEETRSKRLATAIEWMSEGKIRNWKYAK